MKVNGNCLSEHPWQTSTPSTHTEYNQHFPVITPAEVANPNLEEAGNNLSHPIFHHISPDENNLTIRMKPLTYITNIAKPKPLVPKPNPLAALT